MTTTTRSTGARRVARGFVASLVALLAAVSLTSCNSDELGAAAIVDGKVITTDQLQAATQSYFATVPSADKKTAQLRILEQMILSRVVAAAARKENVGVTKGTVAKQRQLIFTSTKGRKGLVRALATQQNPVVLPPSLVDSWIRDQLLFRKITTKLANGGDPQSAEASQSGSRALIAAGKSMNIKINPRYGTWNPNRGVQAQVSGGLSKTVTELTAKN
jgi:hypothetical protein